jgi:hypothetical protein
MTDEASGGIDRRELIKRAGLVGAAAFTAPTIVSYSAAAQAQGTPAEGCFRYAFGWDCLGCVQRTDSSTNYIYQAGSVPNNNCCPATPTWNQLPNSTCIAMTTGLTGGGANTCSASASTNFFVQFTVTCANCFITDPGVTFVDPGPSSCTNTAASNDDVGGSSVYTSFRWNFTSTKYPRWFRFYVKCGNPSPCTVGAPFVKNL